MLAKQLGRPMRWRETRSESMVAMGHGRAQGQQEAAQGDALLHHGQGAVDGGQGVGGAQDAQALERMEELRRGSKATFHRVLFNEITKRAVLEAFEHPREIGPIAEFGGPGQGRARLVDVAAP